MGSQPIHLREGFRPNAAIFMKECIGSGALVYNYTLIAVQFKYEKNKDQEDMVVCAVYFP